MAALDSGGQWVVGQAKAAQLFDAFDDALAEIQARASRSQALLPALSTVAVVVGGFGLAGVGAFADSAPAFAAGGLASLGALLGGAIGFAKGLDPAGREARLAAEAVEKLRSAPESMLVPGHAEKVLVRLGPFEGKLVARRLEIAAKSVGAMDVESYLGPVALRAHRAAEVWEQAEAEKAKSRREATPLSFPAFQGQVEADASKLRSPAPSAAPAKPRSRP